MSEITHHATYHPLSHSCMLVAVSPNANAFQNGFSSVLLLGLLCLATDLRVDGIAGCKGENI